MHHFACNNRIALGYDRLQFNIDQIDVRPSLALKMKKAKHAKQQARSTQSQLAVVDSVVSLIAERGFSSATTSNISTKARVSWGVLQYQFGGKERIFAAVLSISLQNLMNALRGPTLPTHLLLEKRLIAAIDAMWTYYSAPTYRAATEILLNYSHKSEEFLKLARRSRVALVNFIIATIRHGESQIPRSRARTLAEIMLATLRGFALANATFPSRQRHYKSERDALARCIASAAKLPEEGIGPTGEAESKDIYRTAPVGASRGRA